MRIRRALFPAALAVAALAAASLLLLAGCSGPSAGSAEDCEIGPPLEIGQKVGSMKLEAASGERRDIGELISGKVALIDVWATWCQPCLIALPHLEKLHEQYQDEGFTVVGVMVDGNARKIGPSFVDRKGIDYPILLDDDGEQFMCDWGEFLAVPHMMIVDRDGTVLEIFSGVGDLTAVDRKLQQIFGEPVEGSSSRIL